MSIWDIGISSDPDADGAFERVMIENREVTPSEYAEGRILTMPLDAVEWTRQQLVSVIDNRNDGSLESGIRGAMVDTADMFMKSWLVAETGLRMCFTVAAKGYVNMTEGGKHACTYGISSVLAMDNCKDKEAREAFAMECVEAFLSLADLIRENPQLATSALISLLEQQGEFLK